MSKKHKSGWWTSEGAIWVVLDRAAKRGWGATLRLALLLTIFLLGASISAGLISHSTSQLLAWAPSN